MTENDYRLRKLFFLLFLSVFMLILGRNLSFLPKFDFSLHQKTTTENLKKDTQNIISKKPGFYSVYFKNLKTGETFGINENQIETAASVNKVPIIASLYSLDSHSDLDLEDKITIQKKDIQDYGTGSLRYQEPGGSYSMRNLARLALNESDNTAAHVLSVRIGDDILQSLISSWGLEQTNMQGNTTTTKDMGKMFEEIWNDKIASTAKTKELLSFMENTTTEERIPADLPKDVKVYHKTGDGEGFVHDVGIIDDGKNVYFLGVMISDVGGKEDVSKKTIAGISKKIYDDLNN